MRKQEQIEINNKCCEAWGDALAIWLSPETYKIGRLRTCKAEVYENGRYYYLVSYSTLVAIIDKYTDTLYDMLRFAYGYTATTAQHIAKFRYDYGAGKWGCINEYRYYNV